MPVSEMLLPEFDQEMAKTRTELERCPEAKFTWKPHQKSWDMISLATHIANIPGWAVFAMTQKSLDIAPQGVERPKEKPIVTAAELLARFDQNVASARSALAGASDQDFGEPWTLLAGGRTIFTMPRAAIIRGMVMNHEIHHRAQLGVYLRLNDIPVPAIYGPSADEGSM